MSKRSKAAELAEEMAADDAYGYDQGDRWGRSRDCSSLVIDVYERAGVPVRSKGATYTGNMKPVFLACGFEDVTHCVNLNTGAGLERGDVLLNEHSHTAIYLGGGKIVQARINEQGKVTGGQPGDQTGQEIAVRNYYNFPWGFVLRFTEDERSDQGIAPYGESGNAQSVSGGESGTYTVRFGDSLWSIADKLLGNGFAYEKLAQINHLNGYVIYPGQVLKLPTTDAARELTLSAACWAAMESKASAQGMTIEEMLEANYA